MTNSQRLAVRLSEIRQRLNEIAGLEGDAFTDEIRQESDRLQTEFRDKETQYRSALIAEGDAERRALENAPDAEMRERLELRGRASLGRYLAAALAGRRVDGAEAELAEAAGVDGIPLELWDTAERPADRAPANRRIDSGPGDRRGQPGPHPAGRVRAIGPAHARGRNAPRRVRNLRIGHNYHVPDGRKQGQGGAPGCRGGGLHGVERDPEADQRPVGYPY